MVKAAQMLAEQGVNATGYSVASWPAITATACCSYLTLSTDGRGRSDTRSTLRGYFGVDA